MKMDRKCFTSRAYHRAYKEHLKKTGDKEEAKLVAQQALREASKQWEPSPSKTPYLRFSLFKVCFFKGFFLK